jgi:LasA protease
MTRHPFIKAITGKPPGWIWVPVRWGIIFAMNSVLRNAIILAIIPGLLLSACAMNLWGTFSDPDLALTATFFGTNLPDPTTTPTSFLLPQATTLVATRFPSPTVTPTSSVTPGIPRLSMVYSSQSGDSLDAVALHFGVQIAEITSSAVLPTTGLLDPDTMLVIPNTLSQVPTSPSWQIIPDSEVVYSPSAQDFDIEGYIRSSGGYLSTFHEPMANGIISGAEGIQRMAYGSSISPRMLLALVQYHTGWVQGQPLPGVDMTYPLDYHDPLFPGLYQQLRLIVRELLAGYYGWRDGKLVSLTFPDGTTLRLSPDLNAGTVALQYLFSQHLNYADWLLALDPDTGFPATFTGMFGDPWERARETGPLFPPALTQPIFTLPFEVNVLWSLTSGPHPAWEQQSAWAALDFAPGMDEPGCGESNAWVVAIASGQIVRSKEGYVVLDLDGDGFEQTGWVVLYQHIATKDRILAGTSVNAGDHIGHPSCEGGTATGTHVHIARKYNGEWVAAGNPLPFILSGWTAHAGSQMRLGTLTKDDRTITASPVGVHESQLIRQPGE